MKWLWALTLLLASTCSFAQQGNTLTLTGAGAPVGSCSFMFRYVDSTNNNLYFCSGGTWHQTNGGGGGGTPGTPVNSIQFNSSGSFGGDANLTWNNTTKQLQYGTSVGPPTFSGTLNSFTTGLPLVSYNATTTETVGNPAGPFTIPYNFSLKVNSPAGTQTIEPWTLNSIIYTDPTNTANYTSELAAIHGEGDAVGSGTIAFLFGLAGEAFQAGNGVVTLETGVGSDCGTFGATQTGTVVTCDAFRGGVFSQGNGLISNGNGLHIVSPALNFGTSVVTNYHAIQIDDPTASGGTLNPNPMGINIVGAAPNSLGGGVTSLGAIMFPTATSVTANTNSQFYATSTSGSLLLGRSGQDQIQFFLPGTANTGTINFGVNGILGWSATPGTVSQDACLWHVSTNQLAIGASGCNTIGSGLDVTNLMIGATNSGFTNNGSAGSAREIDLEIAGTNIFGVNGTFGGIMMLNGGGVAFSNTNAASLDASLVRSAAGVVGVGDGGYNTKGRLKAAAFMSVGTKFTTDNGCTDAATAGGATAGKFTVGAAVTSCTEVITMGNSATAPNGWSCTTIDLTTLADVTNPHQTATSTTTATIVTGTIVASDVIQFSCIGY